MERYVRAFSCIEISQCSDCRKALKNNHHALALCTKDRRVWQLLLSCRFCVRLGGGGRRGGLVYIPFAYTLKCKTSFLGSSYATVLVYMHACRQKGNPCLMSKHCLTWSITYYTNTETPKAHFNRRHETMAAPINVFIFSAKTGA